MYSEFPYEFIIQGIIMFNISFLITREGKEELTQYLHDDSLFIEGQMEISFNDSREGGIFEETSFLNIYIDHWFIILNEVALKLKENNYIVFYLPETFGTWIELKCDLNIIVASCFISKKGKNGLKRSEFVMCDEIKKTKYLWKDEKISKENFLEEVNEKTEELLNQVTEINDKVLQSNSLKKLFTMNRMLNTKY